LLQSRENRSKWGSGQCEAVLSVYSGCMRNDESPDT
jgi:hypothetical protein